MDGKGRFRDNIFVERLWRTLKYERIYLKLFWKALTQFSRVVFGKLSLSDAS